MSHDLIGEVTSFVAPTLAAPGRLSEALSWKPASAPAPDLSSAPQMTNAYARPKPSVPFGPVAPKLSTAFATKPSSFLAAPSGTVAHTTAVKDAKQNDLASWLPWILVGTGAVLVVVGAGVAGVFGFGSEAGARRIFYGPDPKAGR